MLNFKSIVGPFETVIQLETFLDVCQTKGYSVPENIIGNIKRIVNEKDYLRIEDFYVEGFCDEHAYKNSMEDSNEYAWYTADAALLALTKKYWTPSPLEIVEAVDVYWTSFWERVYLFTKPNWVFVCGFPDWEKQMEAEGKIIAYAYTSVRQIDRTKYERKVMMTNAEWDNFKIEHPEYLKSES